MKHYYLRRHVTACRRLSIKNSVVRRWKNIAETCNAHLADICINVIHDCNNNNNKTGIQAGHKFVAYSADNPLIVTLFSDGLPATVSLASFMINYIHTLQCEAEKSTNTFRKCPAPQTPQDRFILEARKVQKQCGGTGPCILDLGTRWMGAVSFILQFLYFEENSLPQYTVLMYGLPEKWHISFQMFC